MKPIKFTSILLIITILFSLCACNEGAGKEPFGSSGVITPFAYHPSQVTMKGPLDAEGWFAYQCLPATPSYYIWLYEDGHIKQVKEYNSSNLLAAYYDYECDDKGYPVYCEQSYYSSSCKDYFVNYSYKYDYVFTPDGLVKSLTITTTGYSYDLDLVKSVKETAGGVWVYTYEYDENQNLTKYALTGAKNGEKTAQQFEWILEYENNKLIRKTQTYPDFSPYIPVHSYTYTDGVLRTATAENGVYKTVLNFNASGLIESFTSGKQEDKYLYSITGVLSGVEIYYNEELQHSYKVNP